MFVAEPGPPRRLSDDILRGEAFYRAVGRLGLEPNVTTTIAREPATEEVADALGVEVGAEVLVHTRLVRVEGEPLLFLAANYFPAWVVEAVPELAKKPVAPRRRPPEPLLPPPPLQQVRHANHPGGAGLAGWVEL